MKYAILITLLLANITLFSQTLGTNQGDTSGNKPDKYAVVVGISDYQDEAIPDLRFADKDAEAFAAFLQSPAGGSLNEDHLKVLINEQATGAQFASALDWLWDVAKENDRVIIYFSGHGDVEKKSITQPGYLLGWDAPSHVYMAGGAMNVRDLNDVVSTLSLQNKAKVLLIADACRAGKLSGSNIGGAQATAANLAKQYANEIKILSCQPDEYSIEGEQWGGGRGAFSYHLLDGLTGMADDDEDYTVNLREIRSYLEDKVSEEVEPQQQLPMVVGNGREKLADVFPEILNQLKDGKKEQLQLFTATASKGIEEDVLAEVDSNIVEMYLAFKESIANKNFLEPADACADFYYAVLSQESQLEKLHSNMLRNYAAALQDDAQQAINSRLKSNEDECTMGPAKMRDRFGKYPAYLNRASELLGTDHYMYTMLQARKLWFDGLLLQVAEKEYDMEKQSLRDEMSKYKEALQYQAEMPHALLSIANTYERLNQLDSAEHYYLKTLELLPKWTFAMSYLIDFYSFTGVDLDKAKIWIDKELDLDKRTSRPYRDLAYWYWHTSDRATAEKYFLKAIEVSPNICNYLLAGDFYQMTDQFEKAIPIYRAARAIDESLSDPINGEIWSLLLISDSLDIAIQLAKKAIAEFPNEDRFYYQLSSGYTWSKRLEEGNAFFKELVASKPDHAGPYIAYGDNLVNLKKMDEAAIQFKYALELSPSIENYTSITTAYGRHKYWKEAYDITAQALKIYPDDLWHLREAGWQLIGLKKYEEAKKVAEKYLGLRPNDPSSLRQLGHVYTRFGEYEKALAPLLKAVEVETYPIRLFRAHKSLALVYLELGQLEETVQQLDKCIEVKPSIRENLQKPFWEYHYYMARVEIKKGNKEAAMEQIKKALETGRVKLEFLQNDIDIKTLHEMPEWDVLMQKYFPNQFKK